MGTDVFSVFSLETLKKALTASLRLSLTSDIRIEPTQASIFNHPMNKVNEFVLKFLRAFLQALSLENTVII